MGIRFFFFQAEDGIRDLVRSRGLGDVYKRQVPLRLVRADRAAGEAEDFESADGAALIVGVDAGLSLIHI